MICPYCDSLFQKLPEGGICPNCNAPLAEAVKLKLPKPPIGVYKQSFGFMELQEQGVRFYKKFLGYKADRYVPYEELYAVRYVPAGKELGYLSVRENNDKALPMAQSVQEASADETSVIFGSHRYEAFQEAYEFFREVCKQNRQK
jgi:hypothetical protein